MAALKLDPVTHDISLLNGRLAFVTDGERVAQDIKTRLFSFRGEFTLDNSYGFPYREVISGAGNLPIIETTIKRFSIETEGVLELTRFFLDYDSDVRKLIITFTVKSLYSEEILEVNL